MSILDTEIQPLQTDSSEVNSWFLEQKTEKTLYPDNNNFVNTKLWSETEESKHLNPNPELILVWWSGS